MPTLQIQLFGSFQVLVDGQPWDEFRSDKGRALLAYLAVEGATPRRRAQLTTLLWAGYKANAARASLRVTLSNLRHLPVPAGLLKTTYQAVHWSAQSNYYCDALALERLLSNNPESRTEAQLHEIEQIYQGEFLPDFEEIDSLPFQAWVEEKRAYYAQLVKNVRQPASLLTNGFVEMDWGALPHTARFYGRQTERALLSQWLVNERCRLVALFGMGGQGKSALAAQWVHDQMAAPPAAAEAPLAAKHRFESVQWRSLAHAPPLSEILLSWLQALSHRQLTHLPALLEDQLELLIRHLCAKPCLLVLDNWEGLLQGAGCAGCYRPGYEGYAELLRRIAASDHQSCLLLISREQPQDFHRLQLSEPTVRALTLRGLALADGQQLLEGCGLQAAAAQSALLVQRYAGHPLALQMAAETIPALFGGNAANFLAQAPLIFDDLRTLLDRQFARLSPLEQTILIRLALEPDSQTTQMVRLNPASSHAKSAYLEAQRSLLRRHLIEFCGERLSPQNIMQAYITDCLTEQVRHEAAFPPSGIKHLSNLGGLRENQYLLPMWVR